MNGRPEIPCGCRSARSFSSARGSGVGHLPCTGTAKGGPMTHVTEGLVQRRGILARQGMPALTKPRHEMGVGRQEPIARLSSAERLTLRVGRAIFGGYFLYNGINHFKNRSMLSGFARSKG